MQSVKCPSCHLVQFADSNICKRCGSRTDEAPVDVTRVSEVGLINCPLCQKETSSQAKQCPQCGHPIAENNPVNRSRRAVLLVTGLVILGVLTIGDLLSTRNDRSQKNSAPSSVIYEVSGSTSRASVTYENEQGGTEQKEIYLPWKTYLTARPGKFLYISAQNQNDSGSVMTVIYIDGVPFKKSQSSGAFTIASASGICCQQ